MPAGGGLTPIIPLRTEFAKAAMERKACSKENPSTETALEQMNDFCQTRHFNKISSNASAVCQTSAPAYHRGACRPTAIGGCRFTSLSVTVAQDDDGVTLFIHVAASRVRRRVHLPAPVATRHCLSSPIVCTMLHQVETHGALLQTVWQPMGNEVQAAASDTLDPRARHCVQPAPQP